MASIFGVPTLLLLHEGGWDEVLIVAVGLGLAYLVIVWTGRRSRHDEADEADEDEDFEDDVVDGAVDGPVAEDTREKQAVDEGQRRSRSP